MRLCLVEDSVVSDLEPLTLTRPAYELLLGSGSLGRRICRVFGVDSGSGSLGAIVRPHLVARQQQREPNVSINDTDWLGYGPVVVANARWVPPAGFVPPDLKRPHVGLCDGKPACAWAGPGQAVGLDLHSVEAWFAEMASEVPSVELGGHWICRPWDLLSHNSEHLDRDFASSRPVAVKKHQLDRLALVGPADRLSIHESARIDPYTVFDTTNGPITLAEDVWVQPFTRIEGPCYIGRRTQLFRANLRGAVTIGPDCRVGGEVEMSIIHGHSNKYHEGFLGHAYVGEWVNLGAITSNSDLRNDYGEVSVPLRGEPIPTGQTKVGCFIGDHSRTGLGSMLNTGTSIGVMCNVLPAGFLLPKHVPSFAAVMWGRVAEGFSLEQMFATAETVMSRRGEAFTSVDRDLFLALYEQTRLERERAFQRSGDRAVDLRRNTGSANFQDLTAIG